MRNLEIFRVQTLDAEGTSVRHIYLYPLCGEGSHILSVSRKEASSAFKVDFENVGFRECIEHRTRPEEDVYSYQCKCAWHVKKESDMKTAVHYPMCTPVPPDPDPLKLNMMELNYVAVALLDLLCKCKPDSRTEKEVSKLRDKIRDHLYR